MDLFNAVSQRYPQHLVELTTFSYQTPMIDHVEWFATHSVIIAAHGAALAHGLWLEPNSTVLELFPANYYPVDLFGSLIEQVGSHRIPYYAGASTLANADAEGKQAFLRHNKSGKQRYFARQANMTVPIPIILELLDQALTPLQFEEWMQNRRNELHERTQLVLSSA
eukprot:CAMPEP_0202451766 /NCGR_PEP_ID=MMETSP1360-20130828/10130_1 /ASSEMBLY_ACC=CAM_ASM_000848 /TAXON_ID=515479 /ORGANISM="Licmophora paradoxa, Strain CCMP2313" /LENGTH=166 /DNA_ID=CAMNT_0049070423 /DNA_START=135 /DNA_END=638 /DNA_ORIENTATION=-